MLLRGEGQFKGVRKNILGAALFILMLIKQFYHMLVYIQCAIEIFLKALESRLKNCVSCFSGACTSATMSC